MDLSTLLGCKIDSIQALREHTETWEDDDRGYRSFVRQVLREEWAYYSECLLANRMVRRNYFARLSRRETDRELLRTYVDWMNDCVLQSVRAMEKGTLREEYPGALYLLVEDVKYLHTRLRICA